MKTTRKDLPKSQVELKVELNKEDIKQYLPNAAKHIAHHLNVSGFRPGKAPYDIVKREVGEEKIFSEAIDDIVNSSLVKALKEEDIFPYGNPEVNIEKLTPLEEVVFTVKMDVYPSIKLGDWPSSKIKKQPITVKPEEIENAVNDLIKMLVKELVVERPAAMGDGASVDFDVLVNGVPIEGGSAKDFSVVLGEGKMIPGFEEQLVGMNANDTKDFKLNFPKDYKADLAGKEAEFKVTMKQVFERALPTVDDELAKRLGLSSKDELYHKMEDNLKSEKEEREKQRAEIEAVKQLVDSAKIGELPEKMVNDEVHRLVYEFEHDLAHQKINFQTYLGSVGKSVADLEKEFHPKAVERVKTSLVVDEIIDQENLTVDEKEVDKELENQKKYYSDQLDTLEQIKQPEYRRHLKARMLKVKAINYITSKLIE